MTIEEQLFALQDEPFGTLQARTLPGIPREVIIGVRTPTLRALAKELYRAGAFQAFLEELPHRYFEEDQLHAFLLSEMRTAEELMPALEAFLPYVNNWATCDQLRPKLFRKHPELLEERIPVWLRSGQTYVIRFGLGMRMTHFLGERFRAAYLEEAAAVQSDAYYVNMMQAWFFAEALIMQYDAALPFLRENRLAPWTHNKTIQKARESFRIAPAQKAYLLTLKRDQKQA